MMLDECSRPLRMVSRVTVRARQRYMIRFARVANSRSRIAGNPRQPLRGSVRTRRSSSGIAATAIRRTSIRVPEVPAAGVRTDRLYRYEQMPGGCSGRRRIPVWAIRALNRERGLAPQPFAMGRPFALAQSTTSDKWVGSITVKWFLRLS